MIAAVVMAGGSRGADELLQQLGAEAKSLIKIRDREMVRYVVDALIGSGRVERLVIVGLQPDTIPGLVPVGFPAEFVEDQGDMIANAVAGLSRLIDQERVLVSSADIPLLTGEVVQQFLDECARSGADVCYPVVERSVMEARFPGSGRSYRPLRDGHFAGGDLCLVNPRVALTNLEMAAQLASARKSAWKIVRLFGPKIILKFLTRRLTIADAERKGDEVFHCRCKAIICRYPEIGMDVDKLHQFHMVEETLIGRKSQGARI